jgi:probable HAF family extracellular repeat protein
LGYGINGSGSVVGQAKTTGGEYHAFLWPGSGDMQDLETLDGTQSQANGISDSGIVVGGSSTSGGSYHAFIWQNGTMSDLGSPTAFSSRGLAVNDSGVVIGSYSDGVNSHPFVWNSTTGIQDLNGLLAPISGADWTLLTVSDINNHGQIVGQGFHNGVVSAFLLTPVPEPSALLLMTVGVLVSCMARRRGSSNEAGRLIDDFRRVRILR